MGKSEDSGDPGGYWYPLKSPLPDEAPKLESHQHGFSDPIQHFDRALNINIRAQALFPNVVYMY